jgi:threonine dehydrogenase-like Zn-dependent dehydrogenase
VWTSRSTSPERTGGCRALSRPRDWGRRSWRPAFYQGGAANLRLGEEFHHNRLSLIASLGGWGTPNRHAPQWDRRRVLDVATSLLYTDRVSVDGLLERIFPFDRAAEAYAWLDQHPQAAVKVALDYGTPT